MWLLCQMINEWPCAVGKHQNMKTIGILGVQGDFDKHRQMVAGLGHNTLLVKTRDQFLSCDGLIIPGGESTTLTKLLKKHDLWNPLVEFAGSRPVFGTCAGCIILAKESVNNLVEPLGLIDIKVARNAYGRQIDSFIDDVQVDLGDQKFAFEGVFIRAPKIVESGENVKPLATYKGDVVLAENQNILVATFHPELTDDPRIHQYFISKIKQ